MLLRVVNARENLIKSDSHNIEPLSCRCAISISCKVSKKAVIRNQLRRLLHNHLRQRLESKKEYASKWALITLKANASLTGAEPLLTECDQLLKEAGLYL